MEIIAFFYFKLRFQPQKPQAATLEAFASRARAGAPSGLPGIALQRQARVAPSNRKSQPYARTCTAYDWLFYSQSAESRLF